MELLIESKKYGTITILYSDEDHPLIIKHFWHIEKHSNGFYAATKCNGSLHRMHRMILGEHLAIIDHKNRCTTDNRRENLRSVDASQSTINRHLQQYGKIKDVRFRGVSFYKPRNTYRARVKIKGITVYQRYFKTQEQAALAYNDAAIKYHGEFAMLNKVA